MLGSPVAEERKRRWRSETWGSEGGQDDSVFWDEWRRRRRGWFLKKV